MARKQQRKYAAISFTDIVGFSKMAGKDEALALELLDEHQEIVRPCITRFAGREVKTIGDAFMVEFPDPRPAVEWGVAVQEGLRARNQTVGPERAVTIRIGIHAGEVVQRGDDLFGDGVNIAARVEPQSPHGGIAVSGAVHDAVSGKLPLAFEAMEARTLKNIEKQIALYRVVMPWEDLKRTATAIADATLAMFGEAAAAPVEAVSEESTHNRVAVLPLVNASGNPDDAFIAVATQEDLIGALGTLPDLRVIARDSLGRFDSARPDLPAIARDLKAGLVITGRVGIAAGRYALSLECFDTAAGETLWKQEFTAQLGEVAEVYASVAARVAETVGAEIPDAIRRRVARRAPGTPLGYLSHLRAWNQMAEGSIDALRRAQDYFKASLQQDAHHALSLCGMAESFTAIGLAGRTPPTQQMTYLIPGASEAALQALKEDPLLPEAHAARGRTLAAYTFDFTGAEGHLRRALRGEEGAPSTHLWLAISLAATGRLEEAEEQIRHAEDRDPLSATIRCGDALVKYLGGKYGDAAAAASTALTLDAGSWPALLVLGLAKSALGDHAAAEKALTECGERSDRNPLSIAALGYALGASGQKAGTIRLLAELQDASRSRFVPATTLAILQLAMGRIDDALANLERAADEQNWLAFLHRTPLFAAIRSDPLFLAILEESGVLTPADETPAAR